MPSKNRKNDSIRSISPDIAFQIDRQTQEIYGISSVVLMENAGRKVAENIIRDTGDISRRTISVFCGKGNNGGDGFVAARYLHNAGPGDVNVYVRSRSNIKDGASATNFHILEKLGVNIFLFEDFIKKPVACDIVVDAVYGIGFRGVLDLQTSVMLEIVNGQASTKYAIDIPSGLDADSGEASQNCFKADKTITFIFPKDGMYIASGPSVCGKIVLEDIGIPREIMRKMISCEEKAF